MARAGIEVEVRFLARGAQPGFKMAGLVGGDVGVFFCEVAKVVGARAIREGLALGGATVGVAVEEDDSFYFGAQRGEPGAVCRAQGEGHRPNTTAFDGRVADEIVEGGRFGLETVIAVGVESAT